MREVSPGRKMFMYSVGRGRVGGLGEREIIYVCVRIEKIERYAIFTRRGSDQFSRGGGIRFLRL